jgi:hypothetical protein
VTLIGRPAEPVVDGQFFFQANEFNEPCADKDFNWLIGNCFIDVHEDTDQADMIIYDMSGTFTCDLDNLCFLSGNEVNGNVRMWTEADDGLGGTIRMEVSLAGTESRELTGLVRGVERPNDGPPCIYRSRIIMARRD